jgi:beta-lactamase family protein
VSPASVPAIVAPAPREVSFGLVAGRAPLGTRRVIVRIGEQILADRPLRGTSFSLQVPMPAKAFPLRVTTVDGRGRRSSSVVTPVYGLPPGSEPRQAAPRLDAALAQTVGSLVRRYGGTSAVYVQDLRTGRGAAWNARARFPAASTLKLAIAVTVLRSLDGKPGAGSRLDSLLDAMLVRSDNSSANELEVWLAGSTSAGSARVNETMQALGLTDSLMYGGYETPRVPAAGAPIPIRVESQPAFGIGKYTTAWDLARLTRAVYLAAAGKGSLLKLGVSGSEARYLLWLLARVADSGKLDRFFDGTAVLMHKAGWLPSARHDNGVVAFPGGSFVATVMTWQTRAADELTGRVSLAALKRFRKGG